MKLSCAIGLMSGTSMDGIDIAVLKTDGKGVVQRGKGGFFAYDAPFRARIEAGLQDAREIMHRNERPGGLARLEREITKRHAAAVKSFIASNPDLVPDVIGFHGQTVLHRPNEGLTVQLGDGGLLAQMTGFPVIYDMRANDMVHGGQGAPLVPAYHVALAASLPEGLQRFPVCFVNIGGISNVTFVPANGDPIAFDSGPGNALIDQFVADQSGLAFDEDGKIASEGRVDEEVVGRYLEAAFFAMTAPKSLDRGDFTLDFVKGLSLADGARTLAAVSARAILKARAHMTQAPRVWIVCGGGRKNPHIMADLRRGAGDVLVIAAEEAGFDGDAMEAEAWAYLAVRSLRKLPLTFPATTGCKMPVSGGILAKPIGSNGPGGN